MMTEDPSTTTKGKTKWSDPNVPVGNGPPMSRWPLAIFSIGWIGWVAFLIAMALG
jgi:hypothetical protein